MAAKVAAASPVTMTRATRATTIRPATMTMATRATTAAARPR
jgi:hypothetical protein